MFSSKSITAREERGRRDEYLRLQGWICSHALLSVTAGRLEGPLTCSPLRRPDLLPYRSSSCNLFLIMSRCNTDASVSDVMELRCY
uniref:O-6-methylguanine-DNA methyltransferase n=1 Tax=Nothobranchius pienaari TaxID=704102 RepID=A0A1A8PLC0_9TELE